MNPPPSVSVEHDASHNSTFPTLNKIITNVIAHDHHARVRSPGVEGGRGFSRLSSLQQDSRLGGHSPMQPSGSPRSTRSSSAFESDDEDASQSVISMVQNEVLQVGETVGLGAYLDHLGGYVRDCFATLADFDDDDDAFDQSKLRSDSHSSVNLLSNSFLGLHNTHSLSRTSLLSPSSDNLASSFDSIANAVPRNFAKQSPKGPLRVLSKLGAGTYAVVYLVQEILADPLDSLLEEPLYGQMYALKCLCKKDLSEDLLRVQRGEVILQSSLPEHELIVQLYGALETDHWLFLILEYCPGQDLYFWLESTIRESGHTQDAHWPERTETTQSTLSLTAEDEPYMTSSMMTSRSIPIQSSDPQDPVSDEEPATLRPDTYLHPHNSKTSVAELDATPGSPHLLQAPEVVSPMKTRQRLRLVARMFGQMCDAVAACHEIGVSHRDIKPENFIVVDQSSITPHHLMFDDPRETTSFSSSHVRPDSVIVKITDWGLGTQDQVCYDCDCGSKPYMAYECRNNLRDSYEPQQSDIWSLGIVLLNMLYLRNPWADPSMDDPDFLQYVLSPEDFLLSRFPGMTPPVASFLSTRVFNNILDDDKGHNRALPAVQLRDMAKAGVKWARTPTPPRTRASARELSAWASRLVVLLAPHSQPAEVSPILDNLSLSDAHDTLLVSSGLQ